MEKQQLYKEDEFFGNTHYLLKIENESKRYFVIQMIFFRPLFQQNPFNQIDQNLLVRPFLVAG